MILQYLKTRRDLLRSYDAWMEIIFIIFLDIRPFIENILYPCQTLAKFCSPKFCFLQSDLQQPKMDFK